MEIQWEAGTAYELFSSLSVIHDPAQFGIRPAWAAGVRSRIPVELRGFFADVVKSFIVPVAWVHSIAKPRSAAAAVELLEHMKPEKIPETLLCCEPEHDEKDAVFMRVITERKWTDDDVEDIAQIYRKYPGKKHRIDRKSIGTWLTHLSAPNEFGKKFVEGISVYYENFFREEERRIAPALQEGLNRAQELANTLSTSELLEELSQGIKSEQFLHHDTLLLIPSFWLAPFVLTGELREGTGFMQFGARPNDVSLIPGDQVPDSLSSGLQALSDHTRLKILKLISEEPLTQVEIAKKLRLRPPTISHHMNTLRVASLISIMPNDDDPKNTRYGIRQGRVDELCSTIKEFLGVSE